MNRDVSSFIERYQLLYEKDPDSKVFAPLAEAYRRMGLIDEAIDLAESGVAKHPNFASGRVALGKCYVQKGLFDKAVVQLNGAVDLSPENLLAHQLLAECYVRLQKLGEALNSYKMALFLNPNDMKTAELVKKLEIKLFTEHSEESKNSGIREDFSMQKLESLEEQDLTPTPVAMDLSEAQDSPKETLREEPIPGNPIFQPSTQAAAALSVTQAEKDIEFNRQLALLDVRFDRGDWGKARELLDELMEKYPDHPELMNRKNYIMELTNNSFHTAELLKPIPSSENQGKIEKLKALLERIEKGKRTTDKQAFGAS